MKSNDLTPDHKGPARDVGELRDRLAHLVANGSDRDLIETASAIDFGNMLLEGAKQSVAIGTTKCGSTECDDNHYHMVGMMMTLADPDGTSGAASMLGQKVGGGVGHIAIQLTPMTDEHYANAVAAMSGLGNADQTRH